MKNAYTGIFLCLLLFIFDLSPAQNQVFRDTSAIILGGTGRVTSIHIRSYKPFPKYKKVPLPWTVYLFPETNKSYQFPEDFTGGFDSIFVQTVKYRESSLSEVWTFQDKGGSAIYEAFHPNGEQAYIAKFVGKGLQERIRIDSLRELPGEVFEMKTEKLPRDAWKIDTTYYYEGRLIDTVSQWHPNGNIALQMYFEDGVSQDTFKKYFDNGQLAAISYCDNEPFEPEYYTSIISTSEIIDQNKKREQLNCTFCLWYQNGNKWSESKFVAKPGVSESRVWFENGNPQVKITYLASKDTIGIYQEYHFNGQLKMQGSYDTLPKFESLEDLGKFVRAKEKIIGGPIMTVGDDESLNWLIDFDGPTFRQGAFEYWDENGEKLFTEIFELGVRIERIGRIEEKEQVLNTYSPEYLDCFERVKIPLPKDSRRYGKELCMGMSAVGKIDTFEVEAYYPDSDSLQSFTEIIRHKTSWGDMEYECYYPDGKLQMKLNIRGNPKLEQDVRKVVKRGAIPTYSLPMIDKNQYWYPNGKLKWERTYKSIGYTDLPELTDEFTYYPNGNPKSEMHKILRPYSSLGISFYKQGPQRQYFENGQMKEEYTYENGDKEG
ncbi:MAG: hypothetical protein AAF696_33885, partial [Bacteroidota bacterium]